MTDQNVSYHDLPNVPEEAIIAITSNEPTPEDPLHVRHLKRIAVRSVQKSLKSRNSSKSKNSRKTHESQSLHNSLRSNKSDDSIGSSVQSISSRTTHSLGSGSPCSSSGSSVDDEDRPWIFRDTTFAYVAIFSASCFGIFWVTQALFIEDLMQQTDIELVLMGYLFSSVRVGKVVGHLVTVPLTTLLPSNIVNITIIKLIIFSILIVFVSFITSPILLGTTFFFLGITYGVVDSCTVLIIQMLKTSDRAYFTNTFYAVSSVSCFTHTFVTAYIKSQFTDPQTRLIWANSINSVVGFLVVIMIFALSRAREKNKYFLEDEIVVLQPLKFKGFRNYFFSFVLLSWSAFSSIYCFSSFWNFILPVLENSATELDSTQIFYLIEAFHGSVLVARIIAVPIVVFYENKTVVVAGCNATLIGAALCTVSLQDKMFEGLVLILIFFGIGLGMFHQSLLNWLQEHIIITPKTSLPFFLASTSGVVLAPMTVPNIITGSSGTVEPKRFFWLVCGLTISTVLAASVLIFIEQLKSDTEVQEIEILPSVIRLSRNSYSTTARSKYPDTPDTGIGPSRSRLSKLSTYIQRLDPTLSFVSSIN
ncbi:hypothetical protein ACHWQZ_G004478 [Mnemiopsis leidyi]